MADVDPLGILNSELKLTQQDGAKRRANEKVVRQYMNFGNDQRERPGASESSSRSTIHWMVVLSPVDEWIFGEGFIDWQSNDD